MEFIFWSTTAVGPGLMDLFTIFCHGRIWDLPTGRTVDWMSFKKAVTGVTVSPTGEFMCTSHHGRVGLSVWADQR